MSRLTGLPPATVHRAIKYLCDRGHLKTWRKKNGTVTIFKLLGDNVPAKQTRSNSGVQAEQQRSTNEAVAEQTSAVPIKRACEDLKTLDVKTESLNTALACVCDTYELDILLEYWSEAGGCKINGWLASKLGVLLKKHGLAKMKETLDLANRKLNGEYGFNLEFFENKLAEVEKMKGGKKNVEVGTPEYRAPKRTSGDWDDYEA